MDVDPGGTSTYGRWSTRHGLPAFCYETDHEAIPGAEWDPIQSAPTRRHWVLVGNRALEMQVANDATVAIFEESHGSRWLTAADPDGTGVSLVEHAGARWSSAWADRPPGVVPARWFGPTWFEVEVADTCLSLERLVQCPEGEVPWLLVRVRLANLTDEPLEVRHTEAWSLRPRFVNVGGSPDSRRELAEARVRYDVATDARSLRATEAHLPGDDSPLFEQRFGPVLVVELEALGDTPAAAVPPPEGRPHPTLEMVSELTLEVGSHQELWFRVGLGGDAGDAGDTAEAETDAARADPAASLDRWRHALSRRLPRARTPRAPMAEGEVPWHAALLTGGLCRDELIGGYTLNQSSAYRDPIGFNGAARDPLQHALPLVHCEPDAALGVLRNTCAWAWPSGELPYALDGAKHPASFGFAPSDQNLWALALAAEYAAATGDLAAFATPVPYHPDHDAPAVTLGEHLARQFRFFVEGVGQGAHGHVRMGNADWNDMAVVLSGVDRDLMATEGESVLNSAMAAWVLPRYAGLCDRLGETGTATEARQVAERMRDGVAAEWNGRWYTRAHVPGRPPLGVDDLWLEVQPWAILCGAADEDRARVLLATIDEHLRDDSPLGARIRWPVPPEGDVLGGPGEGTAGGIWFSVNMTLVWAASELDPELAWDEWRRMTLATHTRAYPDQWTGTLSGPDAYNGVESPRAGQSWGSPVLAMATNPLNNLHAHSQPLLAYLRLLGVEPGPDGELRVRGGAHWSSRTLRIDPDGHGELETLGPVRLDTPSGTVEGGPGRLRW